MALPEFEASQSAPGTRALPTVTCSANGRGGFRESEKYKFQLIPLKFTGPFIKANGKIGDYSTVPAEPYYCVWSYAGEDRYQTLSISQFNEHFENNL